METRSAKIKFDFTKHFFIILPLLLIFVLFGSVQSDKECGSIVCSKYQYCSELTDHCTNCSDLCLSDTSDCREKCLDYYFYEMQKCIKEDYIRDIVGDLERLLQAVIFLLVILMIMVASLIFRIGYRYMKRKRLRKEEDKKFIEKLSAVQYSVNNNNSLKDGSIRCISQSVSRTMPSTITLTTNTDSLCSTNRTVGANETLPLSKEEPSEDTTLDYASYINQGMSHSPSKENSLNTTPKY